jgi:hypothetical protein
MKALKILVLSLAVVLLFTACTPSYRFGVNAISTAPIVESKSFHLVSGSKERSENDLYFREAARYVGTALEGKSLFEAESKSRADVLIAVDFYVGEPRESVRVYSTPRTYWRPGYSFVVSVPVYDRRGVFVGYRQRVVHEPGRSYTRWDERLTSVTEYEKTLTISAYENRPGQRLEDLKQLWSVDVTRIDGNEDIRRLLPYMTAAALPFMGEDTGSMIGVSIKETDPKLDFLKSPETI